MRVVVVAVLLVTGCSADGVIRGICDGQVPVGKALGVTALSRQNPDEIATVDAIEIVDHDGSPSAFMGVTQGQMRGALNVFATDPGTGYLKLQLDGDTRWIYFSLAIEPPARATANCNYTYPSDPP